MFFKFSLSGALRWFYTISNNKTIENIDRNVSGMQEGWDEGGVVFKCFYY